MLVGPTARQAAACGHVLSSARACTKQAPPRSLKRLYACMFASLRARFGPQERKRDRRCVPASAGPAFG